jgi:DUF1680 family protein
MLKERMNKSLIPTGLLTLLLSVFAVGQHLIKYAVPEVARPLPLSAVRLTGGPLKHAQDLDIEYLLSLEPDRMLAYYRKRAGLEAKAPAYGGWDGDDRNLTGHIAGHYLSAISLMYAATGDKRFKDRADYIVRELKEVQDKHGNGYLGAIEKGEEHFNELAQGIIRSSSFDLNGMWSPWYTLHKTFAGLRDAYRYTGNRTALDVEIKFAAWAESILLKLDDAQTQKMLNTEFGGMPEVLADLYADTGDKRWLDLSHRFDHRAVIDPLARGVDVLPGLHGNTQVPKLLGILARYIYAGGQKDGAAAEFFWDAVALHHSFATGGHGRDEYFGPADELADRIAGRTAESCNVYNMLKMTRRLFAIHPDIKYADFEERALFNHVLGSIDPENGRTCYMVPVGQGVQHEYQDMAKDFTCCVGTGMESHGLHGDGIYYESGDRLWINLYAPSIAKWETAGATITMDTTFPEGDSATVKLTLEKARQFTLALRRPAWAGQGFAIKVNGKTTSDNSKPGSYAEIKRTWKTGDTVAIELPKTLRTEPLPDNPNRVALMWGPLVLAGDLGSETRRLRIQNTAMSMVPGQASRASDIEPAPVLVSPKQDVSEWLISDKPGVFHTTGTGRDMTGKVREVIFVPFYRLPRRTYALYWDIYTPETWNKKLAEVAAEQDRLSKLEAATMAFIQPGNAELEKQFNQQGEQTTIDLEMEPHARRGKKWFSYDLAVEQDHPMALVVTYFSEERGKRTFEILVDGQRVGEQSIDRSPPGSAVGHFFDVKYPLSADLLKGKQKVTVRFQSTNGNEIGGVFGVRAIRSGIYVD